MVGLNVDCEPQIVLVLFTDTYASCSGSLGPRCLTRDPVGFGFLGTGQEA